MVTIKFEVSERQYKALDRMRGDLTWKQYFIRCAVVLGGIIRDGEDN